MSEKQPKLRLKKEVAELLDQRYVQHTIFKGNNEDNKKLFANKGTTEKALQEVKNHIGGLEARCRANDNAIETILEEMEEQQVKNVIWIGFVSIAAIFTLIGLALGWFPYGG